MMSNLYIPYPRPILLCAVSLSELTLQSRIDSLQIWFSSLYIPFSRLLWTVSIFSTPVFCWTVSIFHTRVLQSLICTLCKDNISGCQGYVKQWPCSAAPWLFPNRFFHPEGGTWSKCQNRYQQWIWKEDRLDAKRSWVCFFLLCHISWYQGRDTQVPEGTTSTTCWHFF